MRQGNDCQIIEIQKSNGCSDDNESKIESLNSKERISTVDIAIPIKYNDDRKLSSANNLMPVLNIKLSQMPVATNDANYQTKESLQETIRTEKTLIVKQIIRPTDRRYSNSPRLCRICYEEETDQNKLIHPCQCLGSCQNIHENCLKKWITNSFINPMNSKKDIIDPLPKPKCELCGWEYLFQFFFEYTLLPKKKRQLINRSLDYFALFLLFFCSLALVLYFIITAIFNLQSSAQKNLILGLAGASTIALVFSMVRQVLLLKSKKMRMILLEWHIFNYEDSNIILKSGEKELNKVKMKSMSKSEFLSHIDSKNWYTGLIYGMNQVEIVRT